MCIFFFFFLIIDSPSLLSLSLNIKEWPGYSSKFMFCAAKKESLIITWINRRVFLCDVCIHENAKVRDMQTTFIFLNKIAS